MNWTSAESYCESTYGTHLATISSSIDNTYAQIAATNAGINTHIWIGYNDIDSEGSFTWIDGSGEGNYTNWNTGEPNNDGSGEDCTEMYFSSLLWNDKSCDVTRNFVCNAPGKTSLIDSL